MRCASAPAGTGSINEAMYRLSLLRGVGQSLSNKEGDTFSGLTRRQIQDTLVYNDGFCSFLTPNQRNLVAVNPEFLGIPLKLRPQRCVPCGFYDDPGTFVELPG